MQKLSTGQDSTLGNYLILCKAVFGEDSEATAFIQERVDKSGAEDEVIQDENQMLALLVELHSRSL